MCVYMWVHTSTDTHMGTHGHMRVPTQPAPGVKDAAMNTTDTVPTVPAPRKIAFWEIGSLLNNLFHN